MTAKSKAFNESELLIMLAARHPAHEYAFFPKVRGGTGWQPCRTADAMAFNLWPSRGLEVIGYEIKSSRSDWLRELNDPHKAEQIMQYCDRWFIVIGDPSIAIDHEIPPTWGLLAPRGSKLIQKVAAPKLDAKPMDREFIASVMRSAQKVYKPAEKLRQGRIKDTPAFQAGFKAAEKRALTNPHRHSEEYELLKASVAAFEEKSGIKITSWNGERLGEKVDLLRSPAALKRHQRRVSAQIKKQGDLLKELGEYAATLSELRRGGGPES